MHRITSDALEDANQQRTSTEIASHLNTIWIHTRLVSEKQIMISITDNGLGVPETTLTRLFDHFFTTKMWGKDLDWVYLSAIKL
ncbi:ATP-binding protein [uncultured Nostoc sp.]|uniref:ATP-binding protein n=1 Tax=uncultured Nostoc sp. TaxID=340711 RepID=UPI0035CA16A7